MRALLLAAGLGTRLGDRTAQTAKCMIPIGGRPLLEHAIAWLRGYGIEQIAVNLHHRPEDVTDFFGDGQAHGVRIRYSFEPKLLGTAGALHPLSDWLTEEGRFLVVYGDNLIDCDLRAMLSFHEALKAVATVSLFHREDISASGVAEIDPEGRIIAFKEKPRSGETKSRLVSAGLIICEPHVLDFVDDDGRPDFGGDVLPALIDAGETVGGYRMGPSESLQWIDTPEDLAAVEALLGNAR